MITQQQYENVFKTYLLDLAYGKAYHLLIYNKEFVTKELTDMFFGDMINKGKCTAYLPCCLIMQFNNYANIITEEVFDFVLDFALEKDPVIVEVDLFRVCSNRLTKSRVKKLIASFQKKGRTNCVHSAKETFAKYL